MQLEPLLSLSTAEVSDALDACGIEGALLSIRPLSRGKKLLGPAYTVRYAPYHEKPTTFQPAGNYIDAVPANSVLVIDNGGRGDCTTWGELLTRVAIRNHLAGSVVYGAVRDVSFIEATPYPVFCTATTMRSGKNRVYKAEEQGLLCIDGVLIRPGDIVLGDDHGVLVIPVDKLADVTAKALAIQSTEAAITDAINAGSTLADARLRYRYDRPWGG